jgi:hypothetical protein
MCPAPLATIVEGMTNLTRAAFGADMTPPPAPHPVPAPAHTGSARWLTAGWIGLLAMGGFNLFAGTSDLAATFGNGLPADHAGTFARIAGAPWPAARQAQPAIAHYITMLERGYALHEITFAVLFLVIVAVGVRARRLWAWLACWAVMIAYVGYAATFGAHDPAIMTRALAAAIAVPVILLLQLPAVILARRAGAGQ